MSSEPPQGEPPTSHSAQEGEVGSSWFCCFSDDDTKGQRGCERIAATNGEIRTQLLVSWLQLLPLLVNSHGMLSQKEPISDAAPSVF